MNRQIIFLLSFLVLCFLTGCGNPETNTPTHDEEPKGKVVGFVDAEPVNQIGIENRVKLVIDQLRNEKSIFYQPPPEDLIYYQYVSLIREIRKVGLNQPGMKPGLEDQIKLATEMMNEKTKQIIEKLKSGTPVDEVVKEFKLKRPSDSAQRITEGDERIWKTEKGGISEPIYDENNRIMYIFKVVDKGTNADGRWADVDILYFSLPKDEANRILEDKSVAKWKIQITGGFYKALMDYFDGKVPDAVDGLKKYITKDGKNDDLAHFLLANIYMKLQNAGGTDISNDEIKSLLTKAAKLCKDSTLRLHYNYAFAEFRKKLGERDAADTELRVVMDQIKNDLGLVRKLAKAFEDLGDSEYSAKALEKEKLIDEQIKAEIIARPISSDRSGVVETGEGYLYEIPEDILAEADQAKQKEAQINFSAFVNNP